MIKLERNRKLREEYKKGASPSALSKKYNISYNRVFQIVNQKENFCRLHKIYYYQSCPVCRREEEFNLFKKDPAYPTLLKEIKKFANDKNIRFDKEKTTKLKSLIRSLVDVYGLSFARVAKLLNRRHATIIYHYDND